MVQKIKKKKTIELNKWMNRYEVNSIYDCTMDYNSTSRYDDFLFGVHHNHVLFHTTLHSPGDGNNLYSSDGIVK